MIAFLASNTSTTPVDSLEVLLSLIISLLFMAGWFVFVAVYVAVIVGIIVVTLIGMWRIFEKAGEPGWKALIPYYNYYVLCDIAMTQPTSIIMFVVPIASVVLAFIPVLGALATPLLATAGTAITYYSLAKAFGRDQVMCILSIFFYPVIMMIIAFSKDIEYTGDRVTIF